MIQRPARRERRAATRHGNTEVGFAEGENVKIEYRWAENKADHLVEMAAELVRLRPGVIVTSGGPPAALAAKVSGLDTSDSERLPRSIVL